MKTFVLTKNYGTHGMVDSHNEDRAKLEYDKLNLIDNYRKGGFNVEHLQNGDTKLKRSLGFERIVGIQGIEVDIQRWFVVVLKIEERSK